MRQQDLDRAIRDFEEVVRLDPEDSLGWKARIEYHDAYLARGTRSLEKNDFAAAIADLERASKCTTARLPRVQPLGGRVVERRGSGSGPSRTSRSPSRSNRMTPIT